MVARIGNAERRMRLMAAPEKLEAVVAANTVKPAQKMPVALSARSGPMAADHEHRLRPVQSLEAGRLETQDKSISQSSTP